MSVIDNMSRGCAETLDPRVRLVEGCVSQQTLLRPLLEACDVCVHLAAVSSISDFQALDQVGETYNHALTLHLLNANNSLSAPKPLIFSSSAAVYGEDGTYAASANDSPTPTTCYGQDKLESEKALKCFAAQTGISVYALRLFNVFGNDASSDPAGVVDKFIRRARSKLPLTIHDRGNQTRDFIHVGDVVKIIEIAGSRLVSGAVSGYNCLDVCSGQSETIDIIARLIKNSFQTNASELEYRSEVSAGVANSCGDPTPMRQEFGDFKLMSVQDYIDLCFQEDPVTFWTS